MRKMPIIASVWSIVMSLLGYLGAFGFLAMSKTEEFRQQYFAGVGTDITQAEAEEALEVLQNMAEMISTAALVYLVIGFVLLILGLVVKPNNRTPIGIFFILAAVGHLVLVRIVAFVLLLIAGIKLLKKEEERVIVTETYEA